MSLQRRRYNFLTGLISSTLTGYPTATLYLNGTGFGNITITGATVSGNVVTSGPYMPVIINPASYITISGSTGSEIVYVTNYLPNANTATVVRCQEGTTTFSGLAWNTGTVWSHGDTVQDFGLTNQMTNGDFPAPTASGLVWTSVASGNVPGSWLVPTVPNNTILSSPIETSTIYNTGASGTLNFNVFNSTVHFHTAAASGNIILNLTASGTTNTGTVINSFGQLVTSGQSMTVVFINTNSGSLTPPPYVTGLTIDGNSVTTKWQGGTGAPTAGNVNATDVYSYTVLCTTSGNYTVLGSTNKFV